MQAFLRKQSTDEAVVSLRRKYDNANEFIYCDVEADEHFDKSLYKRDASYPEIKQFVQERFGLLVSSLYIAQVKKEVGLEMRKNYNLPRSATPCRVPKCTPEKREAIIAALEYYNML